MKSPLARENQTWKIAASARSSSDRDGCVLLDTEKGMFYGANSLGSKIWELIRESPNGVTSESLLERMAHEVEPEFIVEPHRIDNERIALPTPR